MHKQVKAKQPRSYLYSGKVTAGFTCTYVHAFHSTVDLRHIVTQVRLFLDSLSLVTTGLGESFANTVRNEK